MKSQGLGGLEDHRPYRARTWNQLLPDELDTIDEYAMLNPELSSREISLYITDNELFSVSESTVYRRLKEKGWIKEPKIRTFSASDQFRVQTAGIIACLPLSKRERTLKQYLKEYRKINKADPSACLDHEEDLRKLIAQKERLYPHDGLTLRSLILEPVQLTQVPGLFDDEKGSGREEKTAEEVGGP